MKNPFLRGYNETGTEVKDMIAEIICVGTELLLGNIVNTNAQYLSKKLAEAGFKPLPTWQDALGRYLKEIEF